MSRRQQPQSSHRKYKKCLQHKGFLRVVRDNTGIAGRSALTGTINTSTPTIHSRDLALTFFEGSSPVSGHLRVLFVQAAWVVLIKPQSWERHGLKPWIEAAKKRLHRNVLAVALANKLARIAWSVLARGRSFEARPAIASAA